MRFYTQQHKHYCGIDLHARKMFICIISHRGKVKVHQDINTDPELFFELVFACLDDLIVGVECVFCWYWLADFWGAGSPIKGRVNRENTSPMGLKAPFSIAH